MTHGTHGSDARGRVLSATHTTSTGEVLASAAYTRAPSGEPVRIAREDGTAV